MTGMDRTQGTRGPARSSRSSATSNTENDRHPDRRAAAWMLIVASLCYAACASAPTTTSVTSASPIDIVVVFTPSGDGASFSARLNGQDFTHGGASTTSLPPGTYQMSGTFTGAGLTLAFQTLGKNGGVAAGSMRSDAGPATQVAACAIAYAGPVASTDARSFQLEFQVTANPAGACPGSAP
jgi:hypothetical protein